MLSIGTILWLVFSELFALCGSIWAGYEIATDYGKPEWLKGILAGIMIFCGAQVICLSFFWIPII